jgi:hypothetical protein
MKKWQQYSLLALLCVAIIAGIVTVADFNRFMGEGIHSFAGYTRMDFQQTVFFVDADSLICSGSSTVTISGLIQPKNGQSSKTFRGIMSVAEYPMTVEAGYVSFVASMNRNRISITSLTAGPAFAHKEYDYSLHMSKDNPGIFAVFITLEDGSTVQAYPGQTQEEAIANCKAYWDWFLE